MKLIVIIAFLLFISKASVAQTEATIEFKIDMSSDDPEVDAQSDMMEGSTMRMYMKDGNFRHEVNMGGFFIKNTTITNAGKEEVLILMESILGKFAAKTNVDELSETENSEEKLDIKFVDQTKEIVGFTCKKAILYDVDGNENIFWYTEEIEIPKNGGEYMKKGLPGMALEFSIVQPQSTMTFSATEFSKKVVNPKEKFDTSIPEGFTETSIDDLLNMNRGGQ